MNNATTVGPVREAPGSSVLSGILMLICGILAIALPLACSAGIGIIVLAWLIICAGVWHLIFAFQSRGTDALLWQLLLALLYGFVGFYMLLNPLPALYNSILAAFLMIEGILEITFYFDIRDVRHAGWILFDGIMTFVLGAVVWARSPSTAIWVIGIFVGISLIFSGLSRFMLALAVRNSTPATGLKPG